ncbi:MAG: hypothetical protein ABEK50_16375 [bacterium]
MAFNKRIIAGWTCIFLGIVPNPWLLGLLVAADGQIDDPIGLILIVSWDLLLVASGVLLMLNIKQILKRAAVNGVMVLVSLILGLVLAEVGLRMSVQWGLSDEIYFNRYYCQGPERRGKFHKTFGWTEYPNAQYFERKTKHDSWSLFTFNGEGFRDRYNSGSDRILVLGDSYMRGTLVGDRANMPFLLDRWSPGTTFLNYGTAGYSTSNEWQLYRTKADEADHKLVILGYFFNDAPGNLSPNPLNPRFRLTDGGLKLVREPLPINWVRRFRDSLERNLAVYVFLKRRLTAMTETSENTPSTGKRLRNELNLTRALLSAIGNRALNEGSDYLIVAIPTREEVTGNWGRRFSRERGSRYYDQQRSVLKTVAEQSPRFHVLDLKTYLRNEENPSSLYGKVDRHLNEKGQWLSARIIHQWLGDNGYVSNEFDNYKKFLRDGSSVNSYPECPK